MDDSGDCKLMRSTPESDHEMDGCGRVYDNIFVERLWRMVKYEEVYFKDYSDMRDVKAGLSSYFEFYNNERIH